MSSTESHARTEWLADEQAALRRVATLVAHQAPQTDIFSAMAEECVRLFGPPLIEMIRYDGDSAVVVGSTGAGTLPCRVAARAWW